MVLERALHHRPTVTVLSTGHSLEVATSRTNCNMTIRLRLALLLMSVMATAQDSVSGGGSHGNTSMVVAKTDVGVLPLALSNNLVPTSLSLELLRRPQSHEDAAEQAAALRQAIAVEGQGVVHNLFSAWSHRYHQYYPSLDEAEMALCVFEASLKAMLHHNLENGPGRAFYGLNAYSGMTAAPFQQAAGCHHRRVMIARSDWEQGRKTPPPPPPKPTPFLRSVKLYRTKSAGGVVGASNLPAPPASKNWSAEGRLTAVQDQGRCGSCWAYAAVSAVEAAASIKYGSTPQTFSRQVVIDCVNPKTDPLFQHSNGCDKGDSAEAFEYMTKYQLPSEAVYPSFSYLTGRAGVCQPFNVTGPWLQSSQRYTTYPQNKETALRAAVAFQPVVIYWNIGLNFNVYAGGMYSILDQKTADIGCSDDPNSVNHAMVLVGFVVNSTSKIWIAQSSWGTGWGEQGFVSIEMTGNGNGPCGMYGYVIAPSLEFRHVPPTVDQGCSSEDAGCATVLELLGNAKFLDRVCGDVSKRRQCMCKCRSLGFCASDGPDCFSQYQLCNSNPVVAAGCPCWCATGSPPPPPKLPPPKQSPKPPSPKPSPPPAPPKRLPPPAQPKQSPTPPPKPKLKPAPKRSAVSVSASLMALYNRLHPQSVVKESLSDWSYVTDPCTPQMWTHITCDNTGVPVGLDLQMVGLSGTFPAQVSTLTGLQSLLISFNGLNGSFPSSVSTLTGLQFLQIGFNLFTGPLPSSLSTLTGLTALDISGDRFTGSFPSSLTTLTRLKDLYMYANKLTGRFPSSVLAMTRLESLIMHINLFTGRIPSSLSTMTALAMLDIGDNKFTGPLPSSLSTLTRLASLDLHNNQLTGPIPSSLSTVTGLTELYLEGNKLSGSISSAWCKIPPQYFRHESPVRC